MKFINIIMVFLLVFALTPLVLAHGNVNYEYLIGTGFTSEEGKVISMAPNGETVEILGNGTFSTKPKMITGSGTAIHRNKNGTIVARGTWQATKLISFKSYGSASAQSLPKEFEGGRALIKVSIKPDGFNQSFDGTLTVTCLLGDEVPKKQEEGIRLAIRAVPINFNKEISGATLFVRK